MAQYQNNVSCKKCNSLGIVGYYLSTHTQAQYNIILNLNVRNKSKNNIRRINNNFKTALTQGTKGKGW